jgi:phosphoribosyl 1,2-cyclic phosphodiesterase
MILKVINSSSKGNSYILENDTEALIIECGVKFSRIKEALDFNLSKVVGCAVTHAHLDHSGAIKDVAGAGIDLFASQGTFLKTEMDRNHRCHALNAGEKHAVGSFYILPFDVQHDCAQPFGYVIQHPDCGNVLFATDSYYMPFKISSLTNIIAEVNYDIDILNENVLNGRIPQIVRKRVLESHMELGTFKEFLSANDLSKVNNIVLIHLSDGNSNARKFKQEIEDLTGKTVHVADSGMSLNIGKTPF